MERVKANVAQDRDTELDFGALSRRVGRSRVWIVLGTLLAFALAYVFILMVKPRYTAEAKVLLEHGETYFSRPEKETPQQPVALDAEAVESQVQLVTSRDLARKAIQRLKLIGNPEFDPLARGLNPLVRLLILVGLQRDPAKLSAEDRVLESYYEKLTVYTVAKTRVLSIQFTAQDPDLAAKVSNEIASLYIAMQEDAKKSSAQSATAFLAPQIETLRAKVADADAKVEAYRARSGLLIGSNNTTFSAQQVGDLTTQLSTARAVSADRSAKAKLIRGLVREGRSLDVSDVTNNELIRNIAQQRVTLRAQLALESRTLLPGHPRIKELTAQLADMDTAIRLAADKIARGLENDAKVASGRVKELSAIIDSQKQTVATGNGDEVELRALQRDASSARDQLESFMQKYRTAVALDSSNASPADARVISRAVAPQLPSFPKSVPTLIIATLAGFFLSLGLFTTRALLSGEAYVPVRGLRRDEPVAEPIVQQLPVGYGSRERIVSSPLAGSHALAESHASEPSYVQVAIDTIVAGKSADKACCVVACGVDRTSATEAASIDLARGLAARGRAILVDFDEGGSGFGKWLTPGDNAGLTDLVTEQKSFAEVIHSDPASRLHILPAGRSVEHAEHSAEDEEARLDLVIDALVTTYDYVVLVAQSLDTGDIAAQFASWTDYVVLVAENENGRSAMEATNVLRRSAKGPVLVLANAKQNSSAQVGIGQGSLGQGSLSHAGLAHANSKGQGELNEGARSAA